MRDAGRSRQNSSISPITSTPACCAASTVQCGAGWVSGAPGVSTSAAKFAHDTLRRSAVMNPACAPSARLIDAVVAGDHVRSARLQGVAARQPRAAEAEHRDRLAGEGCDRDHDLASVIPGRANASALSAARRQAPHEPGISRFRLPLRGP